MTHHITDGEAMNTTVQLFANIVGRIMLATIFLMSAIGKKIPDFSGTVEYMTANSVPMPNIMLVGAIVFLLAGGISIVLGYKARTGAWLLIVFLILATYFFHGFWRYPADSQDFPMQMIQFMKNLGLTGALLMIAANGSGPGSLDNRYKSTNNSEGQS
jgi:putative oxidoreductase